MNKLYLTLFFISFNNFAQDIEVHDILQSTSKHYPKIKESFLKLNISEQEVTRSEGEFDLKLESNTNQRVRGYYDGDHSEVALKKNFAPLGSNIKLGYRESQNILPIYEKQYETLSQGEFFIAAEFSLLRDALVDQRRLNLRNNQLETLIQKSSLFQSILYSLGLAEFNFYRLKRSIAQEDIYRGLYELSQKQQKDIEKISTSGDLAKLYLVENQQYLAKRRIDLIKSEAKTFQDKNNLSIFYRDDQGEMRSFHLKSASYDVPKELFSNKRLAKDIDRIKEMNPQIQIYNFLFEQLDNEINFKENQTLPVLNLKISNAKNSGQGAQPLYEEETKLGLQLEIPIERRKVDSELAIAKTKKKRLEAEYNLFYQELEIYIKNLFNQLKALQDSIKVNETEIELAQKLEEAERTRFFNGDSDFILLNIREQNTANAKLKLINTKLEFMKLHTDYKAITFSEDYMKYTQF